MHHVKLNGIGIDVVDIRRFRKPEMRRDGRFVLNTFSNNERDYCFSHHEPAPHLAGAFAAKEAVRKVYGDTKIGLSDIEVRHRKSGKPEIWIKRKLARTILVSISHNATIAIAIACNRTI